MLFYSFLAATSAIFITAFPQNDLNADERLQPEEMSQVDGFIFDGPISRPFNEKQTITSSSRTVATTVDTTESTNMNTTTTTPIPEVQFNACVTSCPVTPEYNPVCGTDNVDYTNPGGLGCAQRCGKEVTLHYYGRCSTGTSG